VSETNRDAAEPLNPEPAVIGLVGVGDMGGGIGASLLRAGWRVLAYDVKPEATARISAQGADVAESLADIGARADMIIVVVVDDPQVVEVIEGMLPSARPGTVFVVSSTVRPSTVCTMAERARAAGCDVIDAGVAGGNEKSNRGTLTVMIGGDQRSVDRCWPAFLAFSANPFHVGPVGAGVAAKLVNNVLSIAGYALTIEAMQLAAAYGLDEDVVTQVVTVSGGDSRTIRTWGRLDRMRDERRHYDTDHLYDFMSKDVRSAAVAGGERGLVLPLISTAGQLLPRLFAQRDALLANQERRDIPLCRICGQELSVTYRERGVHPECVFFE
jgi:3-hydroxyisobutyrate dehydrogenase